MSLKALYFHALILACLVLASFGSEVTAQSIQVDIPDNITAPTGSTIEVPVLLTFTYTDPNPLPNPDPNRIVAFNFAVNYNTSVLTPNPAVDPNTLDPILLNQQGTVTQSGFTCTADVNTAGRFGVACATPGGGFKPASGTQVTIIKLIFQVVGTANSPTSTTNLSFSAAAGDGPRFQNRNGLVIPTTSTGGTFFVTGTTAASVNLAGRVLTAEGRGLRGALVRLTLADGSTRTATTSSFGHYRFADLQAGQTVNIEVVSKRYGFQAQTVNLSGDVAGLDFIAER
jgi:hypothetical protein